MEGILRPRKSHRLPTAVRDSSSTSRRTGWVSSRSSPARERIGDAALFTHVQRVGMWTACSLRPHTCVFMSYNRECVTCSYLGVCQNTSAEKILSHYRCEL